MKIESLIKNLPRYISAAPSYPLTETIYFDAKLFLKVLFIIITDIDPVWPPNNLIPL